MTYKEARVYLDEMSKYGSVLGLDTIRGLLRELGNPQDDLKFIHFNDIKQGRIQNRAICFTDSHFLSGEDTDRWEMDL